MKNLIKIILLSLAISVCLTAPAFAGQLEDGVAAFDHKDYATALQLWRPLAEQGNADAQAKIGVMYCGVEGMPQDYTEATKWFRKSAEQGNANAQYMFGSMYDYGEGVPQDYVQAAYWFRKSAERGNAAGKSMSQAEYFTTQRSQALQHVRDDAEREFPKDYAVINKLVGEANLQMDQIIGQEKAKYQYDRADVMKTIIGGDNDRPPATNFANHGNTEAKSWLNDTYYSSHSAPRNDTEIQMQKQQRQQQQEMQTDKNNQEIQYMDQQRHQRQMQRDMDDQQQKTQREMDDQKQQLEQQQSEMQRQQAEQEQQMQLMRQQMQEQQSNH